MSAAPRAQVVQGGRGSQQQGQESSEASAAVFRSSSR
jgi:hypothetical protein